MGGRRREKTCKNCGSGKGRDVKLISCMYVPRSSGTDISRMVSPSSLFAQLHRLEVRSTRGINLGFFQ